MAKSNQTITQVLSNTPFGKMKASKVVELLKIGKHQFGFDLSRQHGIVGALRYANTSRINN